MTVVVSGLRDTHKNWWECDTGIAYLVSGAPGWRTRAHDEDLRPERSGEAGVHPRLRAARPAARRRQGPVPTGLHGPISPRAEGQPRVLRLRHRRGRHRADRRSREAPERTEGADQARTCCIRRSPGSICRRTSARTPCFPCSRDAKSRSSAGTPESAACRDFVVVTSESTANECLEARQMVWIADITTETTPFGVVELDRARGERRLLRPRRPLRHAFVERELHADLLQARDVLRALQRRRARGRHPRSVQPEGDRRTTSRRSPTRPTSAASAPAPSSAARWRSRPTTSRSTTAATSTSSIAPTPACTSSSFQAPLAQPPICNKAADHLPWRHPGRLTFGVVGAAHAKQRAYGR